MYEEMERLLTLEGGDILLEIMPDIHEEANSQKRSKRECKRRRSTDSTTDSRSRQAEEVDIPSGDEEILSETEEHSDVPDPPAAALGQLSLLNMWERTPPTSQEPNKKHNGGEK